MGRACLTNQCGQLCALLCCNSAVDIKRGRIAPAQSWTQLVAPLPSYYFTLCRSELAERLKWLANLLVTCPQETTIRPKKRNRVGAAVGFHLIILMIGSHKKNEAKLWRFCHSVHETHICGTEPCTLPLQVSWHLLPFLFAVTETQFKFQILPFKCYVSATLLKCISSSQPFVMSQMHLIHDFMSD